jgi:hypothetical protein
MHQTTVTTELNKALDRLMGRTIQAIRSSVTLDQLMTAERYSNLAIRRFSHPLFRARCEDELNGAFHRIQSTSRRLN